ncbi:GNAT family N-acetyltransferase [Kitasatospora purpeofusca]|uniref:GNAT family N-acetyltransferase n=1 Tax=Kitasatospora purpeofusca TaxID=67352 RepID=UPI0022596408|nr:GNAT family N-acetyltransferase [Kitasatospora purpeofusca]MCX4686482.1 GNAT family N-acetyltransferase [Kitasatospora purpeofusca]
MNDTVVLRVDATPSAPALLLRPWRSEDAPELVEAYRDPVLRRWTTSALDDEADALHWVGTQQGAWAAGHRLAFAVLEARPDAEPGPLLGNLVLKRVSPGGSTAEVGYWTAAPARGRGVAPRALEALTDWAFDTLGPDGLQRLELLHQVDNTASCRVAEKSRYAFDRVLPATPPAFPLDGHLHTRPRTAPQQLR